MRIAAISDIHGDLTSLHLVWEDLAGRGLTEAPVLNAGDTVAYGPDTMECIHFVREPGRRFITVGGNYDANTAKFPKKADRYRRKWGEMRPDKFHALQTASDALRGDARDWLLALPESLVLEFEGHYLSLSHYAPGSDKEALYADTPESRLVEIAHGRLPGIDIIVVGHTHAPFIRRAGGTLFVNPGAVGQSDGRPTYAELQIEPGAAPNARIITCPSTQP